MKDCPRFKGLAALILILIATMFLVVEPQAGLGPDTFRFVVYADSRGSYTPGQ